jgi:hypothetical protein
MRANRSDTIVKPALFVKGATFWLAIAMLSHTSFAQAQAANRYAAIARAPGFVNYAISSNMPSLNQARQAAINACRAQVGEGCVVEVSSENGVIVLAQADDGGTIAFEGKSQEVAINAAFHECRKKGLRCTYVDSSDRYFRKERVTLGDFAQATRDQWGTFAYRKDDTLGKVQRIWAVSMQPTQEAGIRAALELCQREEKAECSGFAGIRNGFLAAYSFVNDQMSPLIESDVSKELLDSAIKDRCRRAKSDCLTHVMLDVRSPVAAKQVLEVVPLAPMISGGPPPPPPPPPPPRVNKNPINPDKKAKGN